MRTLATILAAAAIATFGFAGTAQAVHFALLNGDAEANLGPPNNWNADAAVESVTASDSGQILVPNGGSRFFSTGEAPIAMNGSASMDQDVNGTNGVWGCGVEGLEGMYTVTGSAATGPDDQGQADAAFFNPLGISVGGGIIGPLTTGDGSWAAFVIGPNTVPENSATMNVELTGTATNDGTVADVGFDDVSVTLTDCLASFAKISGKVMGTGGQRGQWSFEGSVGILHDGGGLVFSDPFHINYKSERQSCDFTPTALTFDGTTAVVTADYDCNEGSGFQGVDALIRLVPGTGGPEGTGKNKDRGDVCVDAPDNDLDIGSFCDVDGGNEFALKNGNVHTDENTADGP